MLALASSSAFGSWNLIPPCDGLAIPTAPTPSLTEGSTTQVGRLESSLLALILLGMFFLQAKVAVKAITETARIILFFMFLVFRSVKVGGKKGLEFRT